MKNNEKNFADPVINPVRSSNSNQQPDNQILIGIIADLKLVIDQLYIDENNVKNLILELARRLDEDKLYERNQISRKIKNILGDKIKEGKITGKWIEECLPSEYKRKYTTAKSELSSLSKDKDKPHQIMVNAEGHTINEKSSSSDNHKAGPKSKSDLNQIDAIGYTEEQNQVYECPRCQDLEEALFRATSLTPASNYPIIEEKEFQIPKEKRRLVIVAMRNSERVCYFRFDLNGILLVAEADTCRTRTRA
jgi:hypothetical protein